MAGSSNHVVSFLIRAKDGATKTLNNIKSAIAGIGSFLLRNGANFNAWGQMFGGVIAKVQGAFGTLWGAIKTSFRFETLTIQFKTLLGSIDSARERMSMLAKFAETTPFEMEEVARASRTLTVMSGDALGSAWALRLVGDAAAASGASIDELSMWVGRAYAMIQAGKPFGEAAMRLTELGVLTPKVRAKMEELQATGASSKDVWAELVTHLSTFSGAMKDLSQTGDGLTSTLSDNWTAAVRTFGNAFQTAAKDSIQFLIKLLAKLQADGTIKKWAEAAVKALTPVKDLLTAILGGEESRGQAFAAAWDYLKEVFDYGGKVITAAASEIGIMLAKSVPMLANGIGRFLGITQLTEWVSGFSAEEMENDFVKMMFPDAKSFGERMATANAELQNASKTFAQSLAQAAQTAKATVAEAAQTANASSAQTPEDEAAEGKEKADAGLADAEAAKRQATKAEAETAKAEAEAAKLKLKAAKAEAEEAKKRLEEARKRATDSDYEKEQRQKERREAKRQAREEERLRKRANRLLARFATLASPEALIADDFDTRRLTHSERAVRNWLLAQRGNEQAQAQKSEAERKLAEISETLQKIRDTNERLLTQA